MAEMFELQVITPDKAFYTGEASMVEFNTTEGEVGVYKNHIPMTSIIAPGVLTIHEASGEKQAALISGFVTILPEKITILAETAEWPDEIDVNRATEAKLRAERRLKDGKGDTDVMRAENALRRALTRLEVKDR